MRGQLEASAAFQTGLAWLCYYGAAEGQVSSEILRAIQFRSLDEATAVLKEFGHLEKNIFDDDGCEPQGLLSVIPEDLLPEGVFYRLFEAKQGVLVNVERIPYQGFAPPAEESNYMGFISAHTAYVTEGCQFPIEIKGCSYGAKDIHHLELQVLDGEHPLSREDLAGRLELRDDWDFEDLFGLLQAGASTADEIDKLIHLGTT
jgi:hypothetical protein